MASEPKHVSADAMAQHKADREKRAKEYAERMRGRPTPTQDECDQIKLGMHPEISVDGSGPDLNEATNTVRHMSPGRPAEYKTRDMGASSSTTKSSAAST
ncbi:MAG: hypothetical protein J2P55_10220 [Rhizobiales bacterium]|nr:hypothetical protein [Hyphomicrobiales bacterium]